MRAVCIFLKDNSSVCLRLTYAFILIAFSGCDSQISEFIGQARRIQNEAPESSEPAIIIPSAKFEEPHDLELFANETYQLNISNPNSNPLQLNDDGRSYIDSTGLISIPNNTASDFLEISLLDKVTNQISTLKLKILKFLSTAPTLDTIETDLQNTSYVVSILKNSSNKYIFAANVEVNWAVFQTDILTSTPTLINSYKYPGSVYTQVNGMINFSSSTLIAVGLVKMSSTSYSSIIRKSTDNGLTWTNTEFTSGVSPTSYGGNNCIFRASSGTIFVGGNDGTNPTIKRSTDNGDSWNSTYSLPGYTITSITEDPVTNYLWALAYSSSTTYVYKSTNDGVSWAQVNSYSGGNPRTRGAQIAARNGVIIYVGSDQSSSTALTSCGAGLAWKANNYWFTRVSQNGGTSWSTPQYFQASAGWESKATGLVIRSNGDIFVSGTTFSTAGSLCKTVYYTAKSLDGGSSFSGSDIYSTGLVAPYTMSKLYDFNSELVNTGTLTVQTSVFKNLIRTTTNSGTTWTESSIPIQYPKPSYGNDLVNLSNGNLISLGCSSARAINTSSYECEISTYTSSNYGLSWTLNKNFGLTSYKYSVGTKLILDGGVLYAVGTGTDSGSVQHGLVFKSNDFGGSWTKVDDFSTNLISSRGIFKDKNGNIFSFGNYYTSAANFGGYIRKSSDSGASWTNSSQYKCDATGGATYYVDMQESTNGDLLILTHCILSTGAGRWMIRRSTDQGTSWNDYIGYDPTGVDAYSTEPTSLLLQANKIYILGKFARNGVPYTALVSTIDGAQWDNIQEFAETTPDISTSVLKKFSNNNFFIIVDNTEDSTLYKSSNLINWKKIDTFQNYGFSNLVSCTKNSLLEQTACLIGFIRNSYQYGYNKGWEIKFAK